MLVWLEDDGAGEPAPQIAFALFLYTRIRGHFQRGKSIMANENLDVVGSFIAVVETKIKALQALLESLKSAAAVGALGAAEGLDISSLATGVVTNGDLGQPIDLPDGAFFGKSIPACVKLYMSAAKKKKTIKEIAAALREGGVESTSDNFESVVTGALNRLKAAGEVLRFKDGWGLSEWYPANMRGSAPAAGKRSRKKSKKARRLAEAARDAQLATVPAKSNANERTIELLRSGKKGDYGLTEIGGHLGMGTQGARLILGKLIKAGKVEKTAQGMYRISQPKLVAASI